MIKQMKALSTSLIGGGGLRFLAEGYINGRTEKELLRTIGCLLAYPPLHELGHAFGCMLTGTKVHRIGYRRMKHGDTTNLKNIIIALGGPLTDILLATSAHYLGMDSVAAIMIFGAGVNINPDEDNSDGFKILNYLKEKGK